MYRRIVYSSIAAEGISIRDAYDIIKVSHNRNSKSGLTGGLLLIDGHFFQILEGLPSSVEERYNRIATDPRHHSVIVRMDERVDNLLFESDWMALRNGSKIDRSILESHSYETGMPAKRFSAENVVEFLLDCFTKESSGV